MGGFASEARNKSYKLHRREALGYCDENESVDSLKRWNRWQSEMASIYIPSEGKREKYEKEGHILMLRPLHRLNPKHFDLPDFVRSITNRESSNIIQRAKLLMVEVLHESDCFFGIKVTVSSPLILEELVHRQSLHSIQMDGVPFLCEIPREYHVESQCLSLRLCIRPCSADQGTLHSASSTATSTK